MDIKSQDAQITKLFESGFGARHIATKLGITHYASVSKRLIRMGLKRGHCVEDSSKLDVKLIPNQEKLRVSAEHYARYFFISHGYNTLEPEPGAPYDLVVEFNGKFQKIQVKSSSCKNASGNYCFKLVKTRNTRGSLVRRVFYSPDECDYFFLFDMCGNKWLIPFSKLGPNTVVPALRYPGYQIFDPWCK